METEEIIKSEEDKIDNDNDKDTDSGIENENINKDNDDVDNKKKNQNAKTLDENNKRNSSANLRRKSVDSMQGEEPENKKVKTENIERQKYDPDDENFDFENVSTTVNRFNKDLLDNPIQGKPHCNP